MPGVSRRAFHRTAAGAAGFLVLKDARSVRAAPANERLNLAIVGCRGRGNMLALDFAGRADCRFSWFCDVDPEMYRTRVKGIAERQGSAVRYESDFRRMLEDKSVDAVVLALPPHWHALATIWCCQAGKDVYCEKPQSHNCWEGQRAIEAARKYGRVVQIGLQNRSAAYNVAARKYIAEGRLGAIHLCRVFNQKGEANFPMLPDSPPPAGFDWNLWNGPAEEHPYNQTLRERWRYLWRYCGGDMTYDGIHQVDLARWLLGLKLPRTVYSVGGRHDAGAAETPDTQMALLEFDGLVMSFEMTLYTPYMLKADHGVRDGDIYPYWPQNTERIEIYGSEGVMYVGRMGAGWQVYVRPKTRQPVIRDQLHGRFPDKAHQDDFVRAVRARGVPSADIAEGHASTLLVHYAMISYRLGGQKLAIDPATEQIVDNPAAMELFRRAYRRPFVVPADV